MKSIFRKMSAAAVALLFSAGLSYAIFSASVDRLTIGSATAPALTSCGTTPAITGTDLGGVVTMGTGSPTGCVITFNTPYATAPSCNVTWQANITSMQYTVTTTAITLVQTATSSNKVNYICLGQAGG